MATPDDYLGEMNAQAADELAEQLMLGTVRATDGDRLVRTLDEVRDMRSAIAPTPSQDVVAAFASYREHHLEKTVTADARGAGMGVSGYLRVVAVAASAVAILTIAAVQPWKSNESRTVTANGPVVAMPTPPAPSTPDVDRPADEPTVVDTAGTPTGHAQPGPTQAPVPATPPTPGPAPEPLPEPEPAPSPNLLVTVTSAVGTTVGSLLSNTIDLLL